MKRSVFAAWALSLLVSPVVAQAAGLPVTEAGRSADGRQAAWNATLDLRGLPAGTRPSSLSLALDAGQLPREAARVRITVALNGLVIGRGWAERDGATRLKVRIEDRLLSTRNHLTIAATSTARDCPSTACDLGAVKLARPLGIGLSDATAGPVIFAHHITRFRRGISISATTPQERAWADRAVAAMAPLAPQSSEGGARIVVSRDTPAGFDPELRFDTGTVEIRDRDGRVRYDRETLDRLTVVQIGMRGGTPLLWVRPGRDALPVGPMELDYGSVALFGPHGREIAFSSAQDQAVEIVYAADAARSAQLGLYWRLAVGAVWLLISAGFVWILRRIPPMKPRPAPEAA